MRASDLDFNDLFVLECYLIAEDKQFLDMFTIPSLKDLNISKSFQKLKKLELLVEDPNDTDKIIISVKGKEFMNNLHLPEPVKVGDSMSAQLIFLDLGKTDDEKFEEWWKAFPTTVGWKSDDGTTAFLGSRNLKNLTKAKAKEKYLKLLNQGLKHENLLGALKYEVKLKKMDSVKKNANQMEYFKGMESYFNSERYLPFVEHYISDPEFVKDDEARIKGRKRNVIDI